MLLKENISTITAYSNEWYEHRKAKLTASKSSVLCGEKGLGVGGLNYIYDKVGEEMTGESSEKRFENDDMRWGIEYEMEATNKLGVVMGWDFLVTQQLIYAPDSRFAGTPDGLRVLNETLDKMGYDVEPVEVKCPPTYNIYINLFKCKTPSDVKKFSPTWYWQVIAQMVLCGAMKGYLVAYHPKFRSGNMKIIEFVRNAPEKDKEGKTVYPINEEMKFLKKRIALAEEEFDSIRTELINAGKY